MRSSGRPPYLEPSARPLQSMRGAPAPVARRGFSLAAVAETLIRLRALIARRLLVPAAPQRLALPPPPKPAALSPRATPSWMTEPAPRQAPPSWSPDLVRAAPPAPAEAPPVATPPAVAPRQEVAEVPPPPRPAAPLDHLPAPAAFVPAPAPPSWPRRPRRLPRRGLSTCRGTPGRAPTWRMPGSRSRPPVRPGPC
ncbi:hypothetical protein QA634_24670 [Methylobacterium sp. CB376]|uniref:hypothetical protein n=1 Tax=Methylobacterium sp. CB376 TaxID=3138063 RepID=UPI0024B10D89|nr:hypothetical protein [Methylobacterium nodulans]WFT78443.1 hypothetical protein QA634_24670 [Methylobacterium nodulans]